MMLEIIQLMKIKKNGELQFVKNFTIWLKMKFGKGIVKNIPSNRRLIGDNWVFKVKGNGVFRARLCAIGYSQVAGVLYGQLCSSYKWCYVSSSDGVDVDK